MADDRREPTPIRVLLIEDNPGDAELITRSLTQADRAFQVEHVSRVGAAIERLAHGGLDVVLVDLSLPDGQGPQLVRVIRRHSHNVPVVVLTSLSNSSVALTTLDEGAQDYLVKDDVSAEFLSRSIRYAIQRQQNVEMRELVAQVQKNEKLLQRKNRHLARLYKTAHRFVDNVSHEFRTPLTVVQEYVALMREKIVGDLNPEQCRMLDVMADRTDDLNNMVHDMLDVSKLEAGMLASWRKRCTIEDVITHVRPALERKAANKQVQIEFRIPHHLPEIFCDPEKIGRVVTNLAINAIKFCGEPGQVAIEARLASDSRDVEVLVTDNGPGIDQHSLAEIFQRFKQLGGASRGSTKGFGLGLSIAKELVDLNYGRMHVETSPEQGSTFSFVVPLAEPVNIVRRYLRRLMHRKKDAPYVSLIMLRLCDETTADLADDVDSLLSYVLRKWDLLLRVDTRRWLLLVPMPGDESQAVIERIESIRSETNRNRPFEPLPCVEASICGTWEVTRKYEILDRVRLSLESLEASSL